MFKVYSIENQNFYLNNSLISGVQNLDISYDNNINPSITIGDDNNNYFVSKPVISNIGLSYILSENDQFLRFTGSSPFQGKIEYGNKFFTFSSGYLTNYSINYRFGEYPKVDIKSIIFGELGNTSGIFTYQPKQLNNFKPADNFYIDLNLNEANFNRLQSFNFDIEVPREPVYTIGSYLPDNVIIKYPINISLNFQFSLSEYNQEKVTSLFTGITQKDLNISFKEYNTNKNLLTLNLSNLITSQSQLNYTINDDAKLSIILNTYILSGT